MPHVRKFFLCAPAVFLAAALSIPELNSSPRSARPGALGEKAARPAFSPRAISPDEKEIAFISGGDIWTVPPARGRKFFRRAVAESEVEPNRSKAAIRAQEPIRIGNRCGY